MCFRLQQKSMKLNDLGHQFTALSSLVSVMCVVTKRLRLESCGFRYEVALYLSYQHIKLDDEIKRKPIEFQHNF